MPEAFLATPVITDKSEYPLGDSYQPGAHAGPAGSQGVTLTVRQGIALCDVAAWPGQGDRVRAAIGAATGLSLDGVRGASSPTAQALEHAPARWTVISGETDLPLTLLAAVGDAGTVVDLCHGRTVFHMDGPASRHVLAKLFAVDLRPTRFPVGAGLAAKHHEMFAQIQRSGQTAYDLIVYRSYARAFWHALTRAAEETGYVVG